MPPATPPHVIFEQPAPCDDASAAEASFHQMVGAESAPDAGWSVRVRVSGLPGALRAEGTISDGAERAVSRREFDSASGACLPLARAVGVWAVLVLDDEARRAAAAAAATAPAASPAASALVPIPGGIEEDTAATWAATRPRPPLRMDLGVSTWAMGGTGAGALAGASVFALSTAGAGWYVRPALMFGRSTLRGDGAYAGFLGAFRLDGCGRPVGALREHHAGWQVDLCGGGELGMHTYAAGQPQAVTKLLIALGPSASVMYEPESGPSFELRGVGALNVGALLPQELTDPVRQSPFIGRLELGLLWRLQ